MLHCDEVRTGTSSEFCVHMSRQFTITKWLLGGTVVLVVVAGVVFFLLDKEPASEEVSEPEPGPVPMVDLGGLDSRDYATRFRAALELVRSENGDVETLLTKIERQVPESSPARTTVDFIRWSRSGEPLPPPSQREGRRPNILLISIDTLRADHLGCYGYSRPTSPNIDKLAERGVLFENAFSPTSWTLPGHMSIFTSLYPSFHKLEARRGGLHLDSSEITIAELLKATGYRTASFVNHPYLAARWGFDQGFDIYFRHPTIVRAAEQTETVTHWLEWHVFHQRRDLEPAEFFLFVHFMDPHETYNAPQPFRDRYTEHYQGPLQPEDHLVTLFTKKDFESEADYRYTLALYDGDISYVDDQIGRLLNVLGNLDVLDSTIIVLTSDHGEEFKDHGSMGHKTTVYAEQLHVPLIIVYPPRITAGQRISSQASLVDIYPTLAGLVGEEVPAQTQGTDLGVFWTDAAKPEQDRADPRHAPESGPLFAELGPLGRPWEGTPPKRAIRTEKYRLIWNQNRDVKELFDISVDPREQRDLYASMRSSPKVRRLERQLKAFIEAGAAYKPGAPDQNKIEIDRKTQEQLRALGYAD
jgi:arylsulfatase A-like enzyme